MLKGLSLASLAVLMGLAATPAFAHVDVVVGIAPPAPIVEVAPAPRVGFVWAPGYYAWQDNVHVWVPGRWMADRPGYHWVADRWIPRGGRYAYVHGHWER